MACHGGGNFVIYIFITGGEYFMDLKVLVKYH